MPHKERVTKIVDGDTFETDRRKNPVQLANVDTSKLHAPGGPEDRLFNGHNIREGGDPWIFGETTGSAIARQVEKHFIEVDDAQGGTGGGDSRSRYVYAHKIRLHTVQ